MNRLRENTPSESEWNYISDRIIETNDISPRSSYITLTNRRADVINHLWFLKAEERFTLQATARDRRGIDVYDSISRVRSEQLNNLKPVLELGIGLEYDFVINLYTKDGLTNGTPCIVRKFEVHPIHGEIIWIEPLDSSVGKYYRQKYEPLYAHLEDPNKRKWLPVQRMKKEVKIGKESVIMKQFPLRPAKARTVNRTQGATLKFIAIDFSDWSGRPHVVYVALSRTPSKENVIAVRRKGFEPKDVVHDPQCHDEM